MPIAKRAQEIPLNNLIANPWNTNTVDRGGQAALERSLDEFGQYRDLIVRPHPERDGKFEILGGQHRAELLERQGEAIAVCTIMEGLTEPQARKLGLIDNGRYWSDDPEALQELVSELEEIEGEEILFDLPPDLLLLDEDDENHASYGEPGDNYDGDGDGEDTTKRFIFSAPLTRAESLEIQRCKTLLKIRTDESLLKKLITWAKESGKI